MGVLGEPSFDEIGGRFVARLYAFAGVSVAVWAALESYWDDNRLLLFLVVCAMGAFVPRFLPWASHSGLLLRLMVVGAGLVQAGFVPLWIDHPAMLVFPALGTAYAGTVLARPWVVGQMVPVALVHLVLRNSDVGARSALAETLMYAGLWGTIGLVPLWMRGRINASNERLVAAQALRAEMDRAEVENREAEAERVRLELAQRRELAATLRERVTEVGQEATEIEEQSSSIAAAVDQLADSLLRAATTAARTEERLHAISATASESQESIGRLDSAGQEIVGIVDTITALSDHTNLLALNATIEAARAGDAGKSFAVVADEVKDLAYRTTTSASGIGSVVDHIRREVDASTSAIATVVSLFADLEGEQHRLSEEVAAQTDVVTVIAAAAFEGVERVGRIERALEHLDGQAVDLVNGA